MRKKGFAPCLKFRYPETQTFQKIPKQTFSKWVIAEFGAAE
jgi:hypothetical protein